MFLSTFFLLRTVFRLIQLFYSQSQNCYKIVTVKRINSVSQIDKLVFIAIERSDTFG